MKSFCYLGDRLNASNRSDSGNSKNVNWMDKI